jgi:hypothetical protein
MSRFLSWLALGVAAAFLVVASASFSSAATAALAFAISIGTLVVSAGHRGLRPPVCPVAGHRRGGRRGQRLDDRRQPDFLPVDGAEPGAWRIARHQWPRGRGPDRTRAVARASCAIGQGQLDRTRRETRRGRVGPGPSLRQREPCRPPLPQRSSARQDADLLAVGSGKTALVRFRQGELAT